MHGHHVVVTAPRWDLSLRTSLLGVDIFCRFDKALSVRFVFFASWSPVAEAYRWDNYWVEILWLFRLRHERYVAHVRFRKQILGQVRLICAGLICHRTDAPLIGDFSPLWWNWATALIVSYLNRLEISRRAILLQFSALQEKLQHLLHLFLVDAIIALMAYMLGLKLLLPREVPPMQQLVNIALRLEQPHIVRFELLVGAIKCVIVGGRRLWAEHPSGSHEALLLACWQQVCVLGVHEHIGCVKSSSYIGSLLHVSILAHLA